MSAIERRRVLITGAAGRIGRALAAHLGDRYALRLLYHRSVPDEHQEVAARARERGAAVALEGTPHDVFVGDVGDLDAVERACTGIDAVAHMAADPRVQAPWDDILRANIVGTYNVYEGARRAGTSTVVFASSNHATGFYEKQHVFTTTEMPARPDSYYGVSKCFGEDLGRYYVDAYDMRVVCLRIGSFLPRPRGVRNLSTWISHRDMAQMVWRAIESDVRFGIYYGISGNTRAYWDISSARRDLGYVPEDNAEAFAAEVTAAGR